jgi:polysaccharide deacetylase 2 family uncharacterized protein YibQ
MAADDDDFDLDDDKITGESGVPAPTDYDDDDDFDFDDDFDDHDKESKLKALFAEKGKLIGIVAGAVIGLSVIGGGAYWFFSGDDGDTADGTKPKGNVGSAVEMALQQQATGGLTPPTTGAKLTQGGVTGGTTAGVTASPKLSATTAAGATANMASATVTGGMGGYTPDNPDAPLSTAAVGEVGVTIPAVLPQAVKNLGEPITAQPLPAANDQSLFEPTELGLLPTISKDGREPWKSYARPFAADPSTPVVALIVEGLGQSTALTEAAIAHLPLDVTLSFSAYGQGLKNWVAAARQQGHEVLLELPMESEAFPADDPGPMAMMTSKTPSENLKNLNLLMMQAQGYVGFVGTHGSQFTKNPKALAPVLGEMKTRGLLFMDPRTSDSSLTLDLADQMQMPRAIADLTIDPNVSDRRLRAQLDTLETLAKNQGATAAIISATPNSIKTIKDWATSLNGVKIAPISSLVGRQKQ